MQEFWTLQDWRIAYQEKYFELDDLYAYVTSIDNHNHAWISLASREQLQQQIDALNHQDSKVLPLYGIPFAVKDNIDVAGFYTTAACPDIAYMAEQDATVVTKLKQAGAIVIGKTNLDQFATGLVGVRSPYGAVQNSFNPEYISGGSSSGSSVAVAKGQVPFALGTDTAGSGRVPAGHNNIVGLKPTKGWFSSKGLIPACRLIDVISIFALNVDDAWEIAQIMQGYDIGDDYSRHHPENVPASFSKYKIAIPKQLQWYGDENAKETFDLAIHKIQQLSYTVEAIDFSIFNELAASLYNKAWVAERTVAVERLVTREQCHPVIAQIIAQADQFAATDAMQAEYDCAHLQRQIQTVLADYDALMVPTAPTIYRIKDVEVDPINKNSHMGAYTNFVNLADLSALALPNVIRADGLPSGVTFIAPAWQDQALARFGQQWQELSGLAVGCSVQVVAKFYQPSLAIESSHYVRLAVVGAHLTGMPLNFQLATRQGVLKQKTQTSAHYQLYALNNTTPPKPGLQYVEKGECIAVEVWEIPNALFGAIVAEVPAPLGIGNVQLQDGSWVKGFICEAYALQDAVNISHFGGWRNYIAARQSSSQAKR